MSAFDSLRQRSGDPLIDDERLSGFEVTRW